MVNKISNIAVISHDHDEIVKILTQKLFLVILTFCS